MTIIEPDKRRGRKARPTSTVVAAAPPAAMPAPQHAAAGGALDREFMLALVKDTSVDLDRLDRAIEMQKRERATTAMVEFDLALSLVQTELPVIEKKGTVDTGKGKFSYAKWEDINEAIKPVLSKHGFALRFAIDQTEQGIVTVTGILSHAGGHRETTQMRLPIDTTGGKNNVQAYGSSTSYGKRYTAAALLNLTARDEDDDGKAAGTAVITDVQADEIRGLIEKSGTDINNFLRWAGVDSIPDITAAAYKNCVGALKTKIAQAQKAKGP